MLKHISAQKPPHPLVSWVSETWGIQLLGKVWYSDTDLQIIFNIEFRKTTASKCLLSRAAIPLEWQLAYASHAFFSLRYVRVSIAPEWLRLSFGWSELRSPREMGWNWRYRRCWFRAILTLQSILMCVYSESSTKHGWPQAPNILQNGGGVEDEEIWRRKNMQERCRSVKLMFMPSLPTYLIYQRRHY